MPNKLLTSVLNYLPYHVAKAYLHNPSKSLIGQENRFLAVSLFADVSGFTKMSEALSAMGKEGAEELTSILNRYFSEMITIIHDYGGIVGKFGGDAMTIIFPKEDSDWENLILRSVQCALNMQSKMKNFTGMKTSIGNFDLTMKIGISSGEIYTRVVGDRKIRLEYIMAGKILDDTADAEHHAEPGEIIIDEKTLRKSINLIVGEEREGYFPIVKIQGEAQKRQLPKLEYPSAPPKKLTETLSRYLPIPIYNRLKLNQPKFIGEHRLVTILFISFWGLDYDNDDRIGEKLQQFFQKVSEVSNQYDGYINKIDMGDKGSKIIILFGAPIAHENDEELALLTALKIRDFLPQLNFKLNLKIGINTGFVFAGNVGSSQREEYTVMGDAVNLSARLMAACAPNQILISEVTYSKIRHLFDVASLPPIQVKGKSQPIPIYSVKSIKRDGGTKELLKRYHKKMVGRKRELEKIDGILAKVEQGEGQILSIFGDAGIGKSRLVGEVITRAYDAGFVGYGGECLSYGAHTPYLPWIDLLTSYFQLNSSDSRKGKIEKIRQKLSAKNTNLLERLPLIANILGLNIPDNDLTKNFDAKLRKESLFDLIFQFFRGEKIFLLVDDLHWVDEISLELIQYLAHNLADQQILMILVYRPLPKPFKKKYAKIEQYPYYNAIELKPLSIEESLELATAKLSIKEIPDDFRELVSQRAEGNPFFVEEIVNSLLDLGIIHWDEENQQHKIVGDISKVEIPHDINSLIMARIDRLDEQSKLAIKVASVIGRFFKLSILEGVYPIKVKEDILHDQLEKLSGLELTPLEHPEPDWEYIFKHIITQEVAYESLLFAHRRDLHEKVGNYFEEHYSENLQQFYPLLAYHFGLTHNKAKKLLYYEKAGDQAKSQFSNSDALAYYDKLIAECDDEEKNDHIRLRKGQVLQLIGENMKADELFVRISNNFKQRRDHLHYLESLYELQEIQRTIGQVVKAEKSIEAGLESSRKNKLNASEGNFLRAFGMWHLERGNYDEAMRNFEKALEIQEKLENLKEVSHILGNIGNTHFRKGDYHKAIEFYEKGIDIAKVIKNKILEVMWLSNIGGSYLSLSEYENAIECYQEALKNCRRLGDKRGEGDTALNMGIIYLYSGDYINSAKLMKKALKISHQINNKELECATLGNMGILSSDTGEPEKAISNYSQALSIAKEIDDKELEVFYVGNLGSICLDQGKMENALSFYNKAIKLAKQMGSKYTEGMYLGNIGEVYQELGDYKNAIQIYQEALNLHRNIDEQRGEAIWLGNIGTTYKLMGEYNKAQKYLQEALELNEKIGSQQYLAENHISLGELEILLGDPDGMAKIQKGLSIAEEIGNPAMIILGKLTLGKLMLQQSQLKGEEYLQDALSLAQETGNIKDREKIKSILAK